MPQVSGTIDMNRDLPGLKQAVYQNHFKGQNHVARNK